MIKRRAVQHTRIVNKSTRNAKLKLFEGVAGIDHVHAVSDADLVCSKRKAGQILDDVFRRLHLHLMQTLGPTKAAHRGLLMLNVFVERGVDPIMLRMNVKKQEQVH